MNQKRIMLCTSILTFFIIFLSIFLFKQISKKDNDTKEEIIIKNIENKIECNENRNVEAKNNETNGILQSVDDLLLKNVDGKKTKFTFIYENEVFNATYTKDNWHIEDSYKINNKNDITIICKALTDIYPIHGKDMKSFRTIDDLVYEWLQHNIAYNFLPEDSPWIDNARSVDLDSEDQGRSIKEIYEARTGKKFNIEDIK